MTERRKAKVGDTIRLNGKHPYRKVGEHAVTRVVEGGITIDGVKSTYWVEWQDDPKDPLATAWESQFDIVEPAETKPQKGDRVKLTPKDGGETAIYGELGDPWGDCYSVSVTKFTHNSYPKQEWNIELVEPTTKEILNALGENAYVAHRTNAEWSPYVKIEGQWRLLDDGYIEPDYVKNIADYIDHDGFEIIFEGIKE